MKRHRLPLSLLALLMCGTAVLACNVPVFRYALERWPADLYEVVILHDGPLDDSASARMDALRKSKTENPANFNVRFIDVAQGKDELFTQTVEAARRERPTVDGGALSAKRPRGARSGCQRRSVYRRRRSSTLPIHRSGKSSRRNCSMVIRPSGSLSPADIRIRTHQR